VVNSIRTTAKLEGLGALVDKLRAEQPDRWRMIVFTTRRETQTTIAAFLGERGVSYGLINGDSGSRNQDTIAAFKKKEPEVHVIVSTEAGSEGVNLQAANVLVNYDLPWNPMVVEQRIGRIQRLASEHATVCIFNIILRGTFEEYIVGRLMEKLQMAAHAIGDVEALLEASGMNDHDEDGSASFEEKIRALVVSSLAGKNMEAATVMAERSIANAKTELESQEKNINDMLSGLEGSDRNDIPLPHLPDAIKSMEPERFVLGALASLGTHVSPISAGVYFAERDGRRDLICFDDATTNPVGAIVYKPGTAHFIRLVDGITASGLHLMTDLDNNPASQTELMAKEWVESFSGTYLSSRIQEVQRSFAGTVLVRVRASVAHDSYERLVGIARPQDEYWSKGRRDGIVSVANPVEGSEDIGLDSSYLIEKARSDEGISEFCRFYTDRLAQEVQSVGGDARKRKKIEDDFTPRLEMLLVGLEGTIQRKVKAQISYAVGSDTEYKSFVTFVPSTHTTVDAPDLRENSQTGAMVPRDCLGKCEITGAEVLQHLLVKSSISARTALPEHIVICASTGKRVLRDEVEVSSVTGKLVISSALKTSAVSGKRAEPQFFGRCEFTDAELLEDECVASQISGKKYRADQQVRSSVSGMTGHRQEFVFCTQTGQPLVLNEAEKCEVTGKFVAPGLLERCEVTGKRVLPHELEKSAVSGRSALKKLFVSSSISGARFLEDEGVKSAIGKYCLPQEAKICIWSGRKCHPEDLRVCRFTGITAHFEYMTATGSDCLEPITALLGGIQRTLDRMEIWPAIAANTSQLFAGRSAIEAAQLSPDGSHLAVVVDIKNWLGLKTRQAGFLYSIRDKVIAGRVVSGKRSQGGWTLEKTL